MENKLYGHYDDQQREYVITNPKTPFPWINYLGNEDFLTQQVDTVSTKTLSSAASHVTATTAYQWTTEDATSTSRMAIPCGTQDGSLAKRHSTSTSAGTV